MATASRVRASLAFKLIAVLGALSLSVSSLLAAPAGAVLRATPPSPYTLAPTTLLEELAHVPLSVFDAIGVHSPAIAVTAPSVLSGQRPFVEHMRNGLTVPGTFYWGAEYCPYCATTTWALVVTLDRFGTLTRLFEVSSSSQDVDPNTPSFTFFGSLYKGVLTMFNGIEAENTNGQPHMSTPRPLQRLNQKYNPEQFFPFLDIANSEILAGSSFDPSTLAGLTQGAIAADLTNASNPVTQAIVTESNYFSAAVCAADHDRPNAVCSSAGVMAADKKLHLTN